MEKAIPGYEGHYTITVDGKIFSFKKSRKNLMKSTDPGNGYQYIGLNLNAKRRTYKVHRLVAIVFVDNPNGYTEVNHKDGDKGNNNASNLEWCSRLYNMRHASETGLIKTKQLIQLSRENTEIARFKGLGEADRLGYKKGNVWNCCKGVVKSAYGFHWRFDN